MCGIFAYSGPDDVTRSLVEGLKKLEYRGYDSSGIAFFSPKNNRIRCVRSSGDISRLEQLLRDKALFTGKESPGFSAGKGKGEGGGLGMGHTRWATHGAPTTENAHPHRAGPIYVIHNGVIENAEELKNLIDSQALSSETDTEVMAHLLFLFYQKEGGDLVKSVFKTMACLKGSYAVAVLCEDRPGELVAFKKGPPLLFCRGKGEMAVSSDVHSVGEKIKEMIPLEDGEVLHLKAGEFQIYHRKGRKIQRDFEPLWREAGLSQKEGFPHFMLKEIFEQPAVAFKLLEKFLNRQTGRLNLKPDRGDPASFQRAVESAGRIRIIACGSSYFAGLFAKYVIEDVAGLSVEAETAGEFIYRKAPLPRDTLVLFISQSGETADTLTAFQRVKEKGLQSMSLCNVPGSGLDRQTDYGFYMSAGLEIGVAATKSFSNSLIFLICLAVHCGKIKRAFSSEREKALSKDLAGLPSAMERVLGYNDFFLKTAEDFKKFSGFLYLGRGFFYPIALEGALKLKETAYILAEGHPAGEMKHGPLALIDENRAVVALLPSEGALYEKTLTNLKEARARGAGIIGIGGKETPELKRLCDHHLSLPPAVEPLFSVPAVIPVQMMAYYISRSFGYNADRPRNLAKSVTVE